MKNALCFINVIFCCHGNICCAILITSFFCKVHSVDPINVCANFEINRYTDDFRVHAKIYVLFDVT